MDQAFLKPKLAALEALANDVDSVDSLQLFFAPYPQVLKVLRLFQELIATSESLDGQQESSLISQWLSFGRTLPLTGNKHGYVHIVNLGSDPKTAFLLKSAQEDAQSTVVEHYVHSKVNNLRMFVPNFPLTFGIFTCTQATGRKGEIQPSGKALCKCGKAKKCRVTSFLMTELVPDAMAARDFLTETTSVSAVIDVVVQVLLALEVAQRAMQFTHYDLHPGNVLVTHLTSDKPVVLVYHLSPTESYAVRSRVLACIIDHGTTHVSGIPEEYRKMRKWGGFHIKSWGQISDRFHPAHDMMRFVDSVMFYLNTRNPAFVSGSAPREELKALGRLNRMWEGVRDDFPAFSSRHKQGLREGGLLGGSLVQTGDHFKSPRDIVDTLRSHGLFQEAGTDVRKFDVRHVGFISEAPRVAKKGKKQGVA